MVSINYATREVNCKIVFYGPGLSGKTTNLQYIHEKVPGDTKGKLISLATEADRTLYFDFLPINIGTISGFAAKFQLYTVPGQVYYNATRKLVLRGADGLVFVADSQADKMDENIESINNMKENLAEYGYDIDDMPIVIQYNKRDLPNVLPVEELQQKLNDRNWPHFEGCAVSGDGVFDTLKLIIKMVLDKARSSKSEAKTTKKTEEVAAVAPVAVGAENNATAQGNVIPDTGRVETDSNLSEDSSTVREEAYSNGDNPPSDEITRPPDATMYEHNVLQDDTSVGQVDKPVDNNIGDTGPVQTEKEISEPTQKDRWGEADDDRPFPGSTGKVPNRGRQLSASDFQSSDENQTLNDNANQETHGGASDSSEVDDSMTAPRMEPSKRVRQKKRGFFKRLFGIK